MKLTFYFDVPLCTKDVSQIIPTLTPKEPKPEGVIRYQVSVEVPEIHGEEKGGLSDEEFIRLKQLQEKYNTIYNALTQGGMSKEQAELQARIDMGEEGDKLEELLMKQAGEAPD